MSIPSDDATQGANDQLITNSDSQEQVDWEKRFKDTQAAFTRSRQELAEYKAKVKVLEDQTSTNPDITEEDRQRLDDLKYSNPDDWYKEMRRLEDATAQTKRSKFNNALQEVTELERRKIVLDEFIAENPGFVLNDEIVDLDVPPRIKRKLEKGEVSFEDFLVEVRDYIQHPKRIGSPAKVLGQPNLNKVGGDGQPTKDSAEKDIIKSYKDEIY